MRAQNQHVSCRNPELSADWPFIQDSPITLFRSEKVLELVIQTLADDGYKVARIDLGNESNIVRGFSNALCWKEQFGYEPNHLNLNALNDALRGVPNSDSPKLLLVFTRFAGLKKENKSLAFDLLDIIAKASREHLIFGNRLLAFVRTGNPNEEISGLGACNAQWNPKEWMMRTRGLSRIG